MISSARSDRSFWADPMGRGVALPRGGNPIFLFFAKKRKTVLTPKRKEWGRDLFEMRPLFGAEMRNWLVLESAAPPARGNVGQTPTWGTERLRGGHGRHMVPLGRNSRRRYASCEDVCRSPHKPPSPSGDIMGNVFKSLCRRTNKGLPIVGQPLFLFWRPPPFSLSRKKEKMGVAPAGMPPPEAKSTGL